MAVSARQRSFWEGIGWELARRGLFADFLPPRWHCERDPVEFMQACINPVRGLFAAALALRDRLQCDGGHPHQFPSRTFCRRAGIASGYHWPLARRRLLRLRGLFAAALALRGRTPEKLVPQRLYAPFASGATISRFSWLLIPDTHRINHRGTYSHRDCERL